MAATKSKTNQLSRFVQDHYWWLIGIILLIAIGVRFATIAKSSIWHDEGFTTMLAGRDWGEIWQGSARDVHPPLYYALLHLWTLIFGNSVVAIRSLSAIAGVAVVALGIVITNKISSRTTAVLAGLILAINPFLIRYSQEARMYGLLGIFLSIAILGVIHITTNPRRWLGYILYIIGITAGLYTHYFTTLAIVAIWLYVVTQVRSGSKQYLIFDYRWWLANILAILLFLPWAPNMLAQLTRGQGLSWLPRATIQTFHDAIWQFFTFTDAHQLWQAVYWAIPLAIIMVAVYVWRGDRSEQRSLRLIVLFSFVPMLIAILASFIRPIFHERYFAFAVIGICIILAIAIARIATKKLWVGIVTAVTLLIIQLIGVYNVQSQSSHQMQTVMNEINTQFQSGDIIVASELYVFFDGSFYNTTDQKILLFTGNGRPNGYGESGLIFDRNVYLDSLEGLRGSLTGRVWVIGKTGDQHYYQQIPSDWHLLQSHQAGYSEVRLYQIQ